MPRYKDFLIEKGEYGIPAEYYDDNAIVLAIRNLIFSKPGNFPFHPGRGLNIKQYQFDIMDDTTINEINSELRRAIANEIPELGNVQVQVRNIEVENSYYLVIAISVDTNTDTLNVNFIMNENGEELKVFNEVS